MARRWQGAYGRSARSGPLPAEALVLTLDPGLGAMVARPMSLALVEHYIFRIGSEVNSPIIQRLFGGRA